jgi:carboxyl-terminal processing protease
MTFRLFLLLFVPLLGFGQNQKLSSVSFKEDYNFFWKTINEEYCYFDKKHTDWEKVKEIYSPIIDTIKSKNQFVAVLEKSFYEIYDHHASLNTNTDYSQRLVPSGTDIWAEFKNGKALIIEVKQNSGAAKAKIDAGQEVIAFNEIPIEKAILPFLPKTLKSEDVEAKNYALRILLAGNHIQPRKLTLKRHSETLDYFPDVTGLLLDNRTPISKTESYIKNDIGYIKINDCLYDNALIPKFDSIMHQMRKTKSLILDLRNTGSGGNTTVAKAILGWFINRDHFYQKHEYSAEENATGIKRSWVEIVSLRKGKYYQKPLVVLVDHWTGSIAKGITIGFDALNRPKTKIIGTHLARLNGAVTTFEMPNSKIRFSFPTEKLYHVNGLKRENYNPNITIDLERGETKEEKDVFMSKALDYLNKL